MNNHQDSAAVVRRIMRAASRPQSHIVDLGQGYRLGSRSTPMHVIRREPDGSFEEVNPPVDRQMQAALVLRDPRLTRRRREWEFAALAAVVLILVAVAKGWIFGGVTR